MCIKVIERYTVCQCIHYSRCIDPCPAYGRRGHDPKIRNVAVGYNCSRHATNRNIKELVGDAHSLSTNSDDCEPESTLDIHERGLEGTTVEAAIDSSLRGRLFARFQKVLESDETFIPAGDLDEVLTDHAIKEELQTYGLEDLASFVIRRAKKMFAILFVIRKLDTLQMVVKEDVGDELLPITSSAMDVLDNNKLRSIFSKWGLDTRKDFLDFQWTLLAPVFSEETHLKLDHGTRLPFLKTDAIAEGAYGEVHRVVIHRDHEKFRRPESPMSQEVSLYSPMCLLVTNDDIEKDHVYAVKQFARGTANVNQQAFNRELANMRSMSSMDHNHIIRLLASFEQQGRYFMIFPLAVKNLRQLWLHENPSTDAFHWCLQQMTGTADALSYLHNGLLAQDSHAMIGYHHDLKPENILITKDASSLRLCWKLSDFGSAYLQPKDSGQELPSYPGLGTYEPPECQLELPQSRAYDIWSLGCIFLECIVWAMKGSNAIDAFAEDRLNDRKAFDNNFRDDYFFTLEYSESFTPVGALTRLAVTNWIQDLERHPKCDEAISALLQMIRNGLLQVDQNTRLKANYLAASMKLILDISRRGLGSEPQCIPQSTFEARVMELED